MVRPLKSTFTTSLHDWREIVDEERPLPDLLIIPACCPAATPKISGVILSTRRPLRRMGNLQRIFQRSLTGLSRTSVQPPAANRQRFFRFSDRVDPDSRILMAP